MAAIHGFQNVSPPCRAVEDPSTLLLVDSKLSCPIEVVITNMYQFSPSVPTGGVVHLTDSALVAAREMV